MKKLLCIIMILCIIPVISLADDLASMSFDELLALREQLTAEIISRPEWKEVTVPGGQWIVGQDIPAGSYAIMPTTMGGYVRIKDANGKLIVSQGVRKEDSSIGRVELLDGYIVEIENGSVIFTPPKGLGF